MIQMLLTFFVVGLVTLVALSFVLWIASGVFSLAIGLAGILLFKVAPILLVGWVVVKLIERRKRRRGELSWEDRRWLEGGD